MCSSAKVRATSGRIAYAERFSDGPYNIVNNGDQIKITTETGSTFTFIGTFEETGLTRQ